MQMTGTIKHGGYSQRLATEQEKFILEMYNQLNDRSFNQLNFVFEHSYNNHPDLILLVLNDEQSVHKGVQLNYGTIEQDILNQAENDLMKEYYFRQDKMDRLNKLIRVRNGF